MPTTSAIKLVTPRLLVLILLLVPGLLFDHLHETLLAIVADTAANMSLRVQALASIQGKEWRDNAVNVALKDTSPVLRSAGLKQRVAGNPHEAIAAVQQVLKKSNDIPEKQNAIALLASFPSSQGDKLITLLLSGDRPAANDKRLRLDIIDAAEKRQVSNPAMAKQLAANKARLANASDPLAPYANTLEGSNGIRGESIFMTHLAAQCIRCHKVPGVKGSDVGPALGGLGQKTPHYILESLIQPSAVITKGYGLVNITLADGAYVSGSLREETESTVTIRLAGGELSSYPKEDIRARTPAVTLMPPMGSILKPKETRDLMAYLMTL